MVYIIELYVDGGCRGNGQPGAIASAAAVLRRRHSSKTWTQNLPHYPVPTNQRAEISAIILGLEIALDVYNGLSDSPHIDVTIHSDSKYAVNCMNTWIPKWLNNDWTNSMGNEVANQDLLEEAWKLHKKVEKEGEVTYTWIPRASNTDADDACNEALDRQ
jgi:ribonuclease HI